MSQYSTHFIVNTVGQYTDLANVLYNNSTATYNCPVTDPTCTKYTISYKKKTIIKTSDIQASIDGSPNGGNQVYTFGPSQPPKWVFSSTDTTNSLAYSSDGINWSFLGRTIFTGNNSRGGVFYNGIIWLAGASGGNTIAYSYDGITWTGLGTSIFSIMCKGFAYNGTIYVANGSGSTNSLAYSYDGINWIGLGRGVLTNTSNSGNVAWNGIAFIACAGDGTNVIAYSSNGLNWTGIASATVGLMTSMEDVVWNGTIWGIGGTGGTTNTFCYTTNPTGATGWTNGGLAASGQMFGLAWSGSKWVYAGTNSSIGYSTATIPIAATSWISNLTALTAAGLGVNWNGTMFIAVGRQGNAAAYSYNGVKWIGVGSLGQNLVSNLNPLAIAVNNRRPHTITFPRNLIVAGGVGTTNTLAWSTDGTTWNGLGNQVFSSASSVHDITFNGIRYIATSGFASITNGNTLAYSNDGINWVGLGNSVFSLAAANVSWNGKTWLATGKSGYNGGNTIAFSQCGLCWQAIPSDNNIFGSGNTDKCTGIIWTGSIWIVVSEDVTGNTIGYTRDPYGITGWTGLGPIIFSTAARNIAWNGTIAIAVGQGTNSMAYSYDGITWIVVSSAASISTSLYDIAWNGTLWVAAGLPTTSSMMYSFNGINWVAGTNIFSTGGYRLKWCGNKWVASGNGTNKLAYSYDGITWVGITGTSIFTTYGFALEWSAGKPNIFIQHPTIIGSSIPANQTVGNTLVYSTDGIQLRGLGNIAFSQACNGIGWNGQLWVGVGQGTNSIAYSYDGIRWSNIPGSTNIFSVGYGVAWNGSLWVALGKGTNFSIAYSKNGVVWRGVPNSNIIFNQYGTAVAWNGLYWVATGYSDSAGAALATSTDGINWSGVLGTGTIFGCGSSITTNGPLWVATGNTGGNTIVFTTDITGTTGWTVASGGSSTSIFSTTGSDGAYGVSWNGLIWVAVGSGLGNTIATSTNGTIWTGIGKTVFSTGGYSVCWNATRWVATGRGGNSIAYSQDGLTWYGAPGSNSYMVAGNACCSNPQMGAVVVDSTIVLNPTGLSGTADLEIVADAFYQTGYNNMSIKVDSTTIY